MITIKFLGGARKSFSKEKMLLDKNLITVDELLNYLVSKKPTNTNDFDLNNIIVAVNGADSSSMHGKSTMLKDGDEVSIIPIIHGGSRIEFIFKNSKVEILKIKNSNKFNYNFLIELRKKFPKLLIQAVSEEYILSESHAKKIIAISMESKKNNSLISKKLETDMLLRFACTTQISNAIDIAGIASSKDFFLILIGKKIHLDQIYKELKPILSKSYFNKKNYDILKKQFMISSKQLNITLSKNPLEDNLVEKAVILI